MIYRRLTLAELTELEPEFVRFLAAQSLPAADWERIKANDPTRAEALIEQFSEVVFTKVIHNVEYLEQKNVRDIRTYHCLPDKLILRGFLLEGDTTLDLRQDIDPATMLQLLRASDARVKLFTAERTYRTSREQELFDLMEAGALISKDGYLFKQMEARA